MRLPILLLLLISGGAISQAQKIDYLSIKDSLTTLSCGEVDSATLIKTNQKLVGFDTSRISKNADVYFRDLGWSYFRLYLQTKDSAYMDLAFESYDKALSHNPSNSSVLWDKSIISIMHYKDCEMGKHYLERYKKATRKKYWDKEQIQRAEEACMEKQTE